MRRRLLKYLAHHCIGKQLTGVILISIPLSSPIAKPVIAATGSPSQTIYERKASVPKRTDRHRELMDKLAFEIFKAKIPQLGKRDLIVEPRALVEKFGQPTIHALEKFEHIDPNPGHPYIERITWDFGGMLFTVVSYPPVANHLPDAAQVERVEITSPTYELQHGLRIGETTKNIIALLGPPNEKSANKIEYRVEDWLTKGGFTNIVSYQIKIITDQKGQVEKMLWTWEGVYH